MSYKSLRNGKDLKMAHLKLKAVTCSAQTKEQKYKRNFEYRQGFVDYDQNGKLYIKGKTLKWKTGLIASDPSVVNEKLKTMEGLVFKNYEDVKLFMERNKKELTALSKNNPSFVEYKPIRIIKRFNPKPDKVNIWKP